MEKKFDIIIVGAGLSGLSAAHFIRESRPDLRVLLLEKNKQAGGAIRSFYQDGFRAEWGPHGFLNNCAESQKLLTSLDLQKEVQLAPLGQFARFLCRNGRLVELPQHPKKFLASPILSIPAKFRLLADLFIKPSLEDQSIGQWAGRRFGKAVLPLVDAAITGTFAGDYERLSIDAVMPGLRELEKKYGSVLKGLKNKKKAGSAQTGGLPAMQNFPQGMTRLIEALARDKEIRFQTPVEKIAANDDRDGWSVRTADVDYQAAQLILALPMNQSLALATPLAPPPVPATPTARLLNILMGFGPEAKLPKAFGYLAPECEQRFCLGAMFSSAMFPDRAPENSTLIEVLVGGRRHPERLELADEEIIDRAYADLKGLLNLPKPPCFVKVLRPENGIPQLEMDHPALLQWRTELCERHKTLQLIGFGWDGIGMNEMIAAAQKVAKSFAEKGLPEDSEKKVKPVYF